MPLPRIPSRALTYPALAVLLTLPAAATTFVRVSDENLVGGAAAIAVGRVVALDDAVGVAGGISPSTDYRFALESRLKGDLPASTLTVRVLGGRAPGGRSLRISGAPSFRVGERVILFLEAERGGVYRLEHFVQGAFHEAGPRPESLALRDLAGAVELTMTPAGPRVAKGDAAEGPRDFAAFARWIRKRAAGVAAPADYRREPAAAGVRSILEKYSLALGGDGKPLRWFDFDGGGGVVWRTYEGGQLGIEDGGVFEAQAGMASWNNDPATPISYGYAGTTSASSGFLSSDGRNTILWNDPNDDLGAFTCASGGTLALGAPWFSNGTTDFLGTQYHAILEGDVVVNDGVECVFSGQYGATNAAEMLAHELGHTLGLDHSADFSALMTPYIQNGRGPALGSDDLAAIACVYSGSCGGPSKPPAPSALGASALSASQIQLSWTDNANNETGYRVEMKPADGSYSQVAALAANVEATVVSGLEATVTYVFRVRAVGSGGLFSEFSPEAAATTLSGGGTPPSAPTQLTAAPLSASQVQLHWQDTANDESGFRIEARTAPGSYTDVGGAAANATSAQVTGLHSSTPYFFRVRAYGAAVFSPYSNEAYAKTLDTGGPCVPGATTLCLDGGRFRVSVDWQQEGGARGAGTVVPALTTADSGVFWFFAPANWELLVKVLNGCAVNERHWIFFGATTNQGFTLRVTDTATGQTRTYTNPPGTVSPILTDTDAFATCP